MLDSSLDLVRLARELRARAMSNKPVIFISYAHKDEPEKPAEGEIRWLTFVQHHIQPAVKHGVFEMWDDRHMTGGADWDPAIEAKLRACDVFVLLVSPASMASHYIIDREIAIIRERQQKGEDVHFYPLLLTPTPKAGLAKVSDKNLRPRDAKPFSSFSHHDRMQHMCDAADEIGDIAERIAERKATTKSTARAAVIHPETVHITGLPETAYVKLVGRDPELTKLDAAWAEPGTNILSVVAEGGAGKSALVNEWLARLQAENYRGAAMVLGWSFYSQGTKERATSADGFLAWALEKLGLPATSASALSKGEAIAEALMQRRILLVLDGVEPLQHGFDAQPGQLRDPGLRALLRRFAATPPMRVHGLIVLTSRLAIADIAHWRPNVAPVELVEHLSDEAGAALLRDNKVWGTDRHLEDASRDFGGHPLALGLLASFLTETQTGDVRRRDRIRAFLAATDNPRHDHARRVMESYEKEWLSKKPVLLAIMRMVGLFDRPASGDCLNALRTASEITNFRYRTVQSHKGVWRRVVLLLRSIISRSHRSTDNLSLSTLPVGTVSPNSLDCIVGLDNDAWSRAIQHLRETRLLAPMDPTACESLDAHPLVREWFGEGFRRADEETWRAAHSRLYEHLRDTTREGSTPTLDDLAPLYQAVAHGCRAQRYQDALDDVYIHRICRRNPEGRLEYYSRTKLGALNSNISLMFWFFDTPYTKPASALNAISSRFMLAQASFLLYAVGRLQEALPVLSASVEMYENASDWSNAAINASNLSQTEAAIGEITRAIRTSERAIDFADRSTDNFEMITKRANKARMYHMSGFFDEAEQLFRDAEQRQAAQRSRFMMLYSVQGFIYCDYLLNIGKFVDVYDRAKQTLLWAVQHKFLLDIALDKLSLGRAELGSTLISAAGQRNTEKLRTEACAASFLLDQVVEELRAVGEITYLPRGFLARAVLRRSLGNWDSARRDLEEVFEIALPGPMKLFLCDQTLEGARVALAQREAFAPLAGLVDDGPPKPALPNAFESERLLDEARTALATARALITTCGYHRRDAELAELDEVVAGRRRFADLPPRV